MGAPGIGDGFGLAYIFGGFRMLFIIKSSRKFRVAAIFCLAFFCSGQTSRPSPKDAFDRAFRSWALKEAYFGRPVGDEELSTLYEIHLTEYLRNH